MDRFVMVVYYLSTLNILVPFKITKCKGQKLPTLESAPFGIELYFTMLYIILF